METLKQVLKKFVNHRMSAAVPIQKEESKPASRYTLGEWLNQHNLIGSGVEVGTFNG